MGKIILSTDRLHLVEFDINDNNFILELVNTPTWIEFIGDRGIRTKEDAEKYIRNTLIASYQKNGFGLWKIQLKESSISVGMCGLVNRDTLEDIDIGFAMLPKFAGKGYGFEVADATMNYAKTKLGISKVVGITDEKNIASIKLLNKIGLEFEKELVLHGDDKVLLFSPKNK